MSHTLSLPMYDVHRPDTRALWSALFPLLEEELATERLAIVYPESDLLSHWRQDDLLLSQTCGYPLVTLLPRVQVVGAFHYTAPGCTGYRYRSFLVARKSDEGRKLEDFCGRQAVCNSADSQSGFNALKKRLAPQTLETFFSRVSFGGGHRQSLIAIQQGEADVAAIDCVSWALLARHQPALLNGLTIVGQTHSAPGLPLITSAKTTPQMLMALRKALSRLVEHPACEALFIGGFSVVTREDYAEILD